VSAPLNIFRRLDVDYEPLWGEWDKLRENDAAIGSRLLKERLQTLFRKWEDVHGFQDGAGQLLLPNGYAP
jgi:hypothetical protein